jgi:hypothetical protein
VLDTPTHPLFYSKYGGKWELTEVKSLKQIGKVDIYVNILFKKRCSSKLDTKGEDKCLE